MSRVIEPTIGPIGKEIYEPRQWPFDGDLQRKVPVFDHNFDPPRLIRYAGWRPCLKCRHEHWTPDISRIRLCSPCKSTQITTAEMTDAELERFRVRDRARKR